MCDTDKTGDINNKVNLMRQHKVKFHPRTGPEVPEGE